jgi:hypothetical protein
VKGTVKKMRKKEEDGGVKGTVTKTLGGEGCGGWGWYEWVRIVRKKQEME